MKQGRIEEWKSNKIDLLIRQGRVQVTAPRPNVYHCLVNTYFNRKVKIRIDNSRELPDVYCECYYANKCIKQCWYVEACKRKLNQKGVEI